MGGMTQATRAGLIKFALVNGAADSSTAGISVSAEDSTAISTDDTIIACIELAQTTNAKTDRTSAAAIIAGGKITVPTSTNDVIAVWWLAQDDGLQVSSPFMASEVGAGVGASTDITISGIETDDRLIAVISVNSTSGAWTDRTANASITADDTIQIDQSTSGEVVICYYMDLNKSNPYAALNMQFALGNIDASPSAFPSSATVSGVNDEDALFSVVCLDETDGDVLDDLTSVSSISADDTLTISETSPTDQAGAELLVFYQKSNDLAA